MKDIKKSIDILLLDMDTQYFHSVCHLSADIETAEWFGFLDKATSSLFVVVPSDEELYLHL